MLLLPKIHNLSIYQGAVRRRLVLLKDEWKVYLEFRIILVSTCELLTSYEVSNLH